MTALYEFRIFPQGDAPQRTEVHECTSVATAKGLAGRLAMQHDGPVDVAHWSLGGNADWPERYLTTASPCEYSMTGYRHERLV